MSATVAQLGARALRKLGIAIVADASRPATGLPQSAEQLADEVLRQLGVAVPESERPSAVGVVPVSMLAARALRAVGVNPNGPAPAFDGPTFTMPQVATRVLLKLGVIASDEAPLPQDQEAAETVVNAVHQALARENVVTWVIEQIPAGAAEWYIIMAATMLAPAFGKPSDPAGYKYAEDELRRQALASSRGQALAEAEIATVHATFNAQGLVAWPVTAVPVGHADEYVTAAAVLLARMMGRNQDPASRQVDAAAWSASEGRLRTAATLRGARARAVAKIRAVYEELNALGIATYSANAIPASVAESFIALGVAALGPSFGKAGDPAAEQAEMARIRRVAMGGRAGQELAEQKVLAVHADLDDRGKVRWSIHDVPESFEEPLVFMAATLLAPEVGVEANPNWWSMAEMTLARQVALPTAREPVVAAYF